MSTLITLGYGSGGGSPVTLGYGSDGSPGPTPPVPPIAPSAGPNGVSVGASFGELWAQFLLLFPPSWIADAFGDPDDLNPAPATEALFVALVNVMTAPGDWTTDLDPDAQYSTTFKNQHGAVVTLDFQLGSKLQAQLRIKSMTGNALDRAAKDFYGLSLPRLPGEPDSTYRTRLLSGLFINRLTRPNIYAFLQTYTGINPHLIDPDQPGDVGAFTSATGSITVVDGKSVYTSFDTNPAAPWGILPAAYLDHDGPGFELRFATPNGFFMYGVKGGSGTAPAGLPFPAGLKTNLGYAHQVFAITTWPQGFGAQGNEAAGLATITGSNPPSYQAGQPTIATVGGKSVFTNVSGGGFIGTGTISLVGGKKVYSVTGGDPAAALFYSRGLMPNDLQVGRAQVLSAVDRLRAAGVTLWVKTIPAEDLAAAGYTS